MKKAAKEPPSWSGMKPDRNEMRRGFTLTDLLLTILALASMLLVFWQAARPRGCVAQRISCSNNLKQVGLAYRQWAIDNGDKYPMSVSVTNGGVMEYIGKGIVWPTFSVMSNELNTPKIVFCPQDADRRRIMATTFARSVPSGQLGTAFTGDTNVSYFVGMDADETQPQMFLSGDDNLLVGGPAAGTGGAIKRVPVRPGVLSLWTNTPLAWSEARHQKQGNVGLADGSVQGFSSSRLAEGLRNTGVATNRLVFP
jgi:prepilin-type processing-associated H-X9-DG protein